MAAVVILIFESVRATQGSVTIDFDWPYLIPPGTFPADWKLPWDQNGFTAARTSGTPALQADLTSYPPTPPPYPAAVFFPANGLVLSSIILTNDAAAPFDLLSVKLIGLSAGGGATTNFARILSSKGGSYDLWGTPNGTTLSFSGNQWQNLSFVKVAFLCNNVGLPPAGLEVDNFVVQTSLVPEPSSFLIGLIAAGIWRFRRRA